MEKKLEQDIEIVSLEIASYPNGTRSGLPGNDNHNSAEHRADIDIQYIINNDTIII